MHRAIVPLLCLLLAACAQRESGGNADADGDDDSGRAANVALIAADPVVARALNDPLMSDPDLASRNEANAAIGVADGDALPAMAGDPAAARTARDAARLELLEDGPIPNLPRPRKTARGQALGPMASAGDLITALGAPSGCAARLREDFAFAADLPPVAAILPRGMVVQAGGADVSPCRIRIIRYHTAAAIEDVLQYHYARALRAGLKPARYAEPEDIIAAKGARGETLVVHVRPAMHGLTGVDLLYRAP